MPIKIGKMRSSSKFNSSCNNNARFMQPLLDFFLNTFSIPVSFMEHLEMKTKLKDDPPESVVLTTEDQPHRHWIVKLEGGRHFKDGWKEFCLHHDLQVGDFLVFTHQLNFIFQVSVYNAATACQRCYSSSNSHQQLKSIHKPTGSKTKKVRLKPNSRDRISGKRKAREAQAQATPTAEGQDIYGQITLTSFAIKRSTIYLPKGFVRSCGLINKNCFVKLIYGDGKAWKVKLSYRKYDGQAYIHGGWKQLQAANNLRPRDIICFQLLKRGRWPIMKCHNILYVEILTRLPVKSLLRFKSVSKHWNSIISSKDFAKDHLHKFGNSTFNTSLLVHSTCKETFLGPNTRITIDYVAKLFTFKLAQVKNTNINITLSPLDYYTDDSIRNPLAFDSHMVGSCNGLICLQIGKKFTICNPAIRKQHQTTPPKYNPGKNNLFVSGFGYDSSSNAYKILRLVLGKPYGTDEETCQAHVFSTKNNEWKELDMSFWLTFINGACEPFIFHSHVLVGETLYWVFETRDTSTRNSNIIAFDFAKETFSIIPLPKSYHASIRDYPPTRMYLSNIRQRLSACWMLSGQQFVIEGWMLEHNANLEYCWTKLLKTNTTSILDPSYRSLFELTADNNYNGKALEFPAITNSCCMQSIPVSFLKRLDEELHGHLLKEVELMTEPQRRWVVKIEGGRHFKDGWQEFCLHHNLKVGDFLVFTYQTDFLFHVSVFDPATACQRHYPPSSHQHHLNSVKGSGKRRGLKLNTTCKRTQLEAEIAATEVPSSDQTQFPSCQVTLTLSSFNRKIIYLPMRFVRSSGLLNRNCNITLVDGEEMSWKAKLSFRKDNGQPYIVQGWKYFQAANCLKPGNVLSFQLLEDGTVPILKCYSKLSSPSTWLISWLVFPLLSKLNLCNRLA
ncbi:uncharacterized protein LOC104906051 [Beta vulgaris subsp. vulgaris]|uniref:uncharacterized protein LOC104906051 n=1 Tax=Beta vulgaris subsp. vulgaris TaxID=3555 RepID=UPI002036D041|nr:uncharacterized protein LOC104906051 [Beta vulgaris subsp. vulgaris]